MENSVWIRRGEVVQLYRRTAHGARYKLLDGTFPEIKGWKRYGWTNTYVEEGEA